MRRMFFLALVTAFAVGTALSAAPSIATANPNFHQGPTCQISGTGTTTATSTCSGTLYGVGELDINATVTMSGFARYTCENNGGNTAPGQNQVTAGPSSSNSSFPASDAVNGHLTFTTQVDSLTVPSTVSGATAGCPNDNWTGVTPHVTVTSISLKLWQDSLSPFYNCGTSNPSGLSGTIALPKSC